MRLKRSTPLHSTLVTHFPWNRVTVLPSNPVMETDWCPEVLRCACPGFIVTDARAGRFHSTQWRKRCIVAPDYNTFFSPICMPALVCTSTLGSPPPCGKVAPHRTPCSSFPDSPFVSAPDCCLVFLGLQAASRAEQTTGFVSTTLILFGRRFGGCSAMEASASWRCFSAATSWPWWGVDETLATLPIR